MKRILGVALLMLVAGQIPAEECPVIAPIRQDKPVCVANCTAPISFATSCSEYNCLFRINVPAGRDANVRKIHWQADAYGGPPVVGSDRYFLGWESSWGFTYPARTQTYYVILEMEWTDNTKSSYGPVQVPVIVPPLTAAFGVDRYGTMIWVAADASTWDNFKYKHTWEFEPGIINQVYPRYCRAYPGPGTYSIVHTVRNKDTGETQSASMMFELTNNPPLILYNKQQTGKTVTFTAAETSATRSRDERRAQPATGNPPFDNTYYREPLTQTNCFDLMELEAIQSIEWDFGDGATATGTTASHAYRAGGRYNYAVRATDQLGASSTLYGFVDIPNDPPVAKLDFNCAGRTCSFDASQSTDDGGVRQYRWTFGDGQPQRITAEAQTAYTYGADGAFPVSVEVSDGELWSAPAKRQPAVVAAAAAPAGRFFAIAPCRLYDSRKVGGPLPKGTVLPLALSGCGVPATATAAVLTATILNPAGGGNLVAYPTGTPEPVASFLNYSVDSRAAQTTVRAGSGSVSIRVSTSGGDLTVDLYGYYSADAAAPAGVSGPYGFASITPCRVFNSYLANTTLSTGQVKYLKFRGAPVDPLLQSRDCGIPADARAAAFALASVMATANGKLTLYPSDVPDTGMESLRTPGFKNVESSATLRLAARANDDVAIHYTLQDPAGGAASTNYVIDAYGYYSAAAPLRFRALTPCRVLDTRSPQGGYSRVTGGQTTNVQVQGNCGVPRGAVAAALTVTAVATPAAGHMTAWAAGSAMPEAAVLSYGANDTIANGLVLPLGSGQYDLSLWSMQSAEIVADVYGYFVPATSALANNKDEE